jgi:hypothetical protein
MNSKKHYKRTAFAAKALAELNRSKALIRVHKDWKSRSQIGALGEPGRFTVPSAHQRVGVKHFSV